MSLLNWIVGAGEKEGMEWKCRLFGHLGAAAVNSSLSSFYSLMYTAETSCTTTMEYSHFEIGFLFNFSAFVSARKTRI